MAGRRALPWSAEAEEALPIRPGRRKTPWRDRPKHFATLHAAGTFAANRADLTRRRQRVRLELVPRGTGPGGPRQDTAFVVRPGVGYVASLRDSLDRMAREA